MFVCKGNRKSLFLFQKCVNKGDLEYILRPEMKYTNRRRLNIRSYACALDGISWSDVYRSASAGIATDDLKTHICSACRLARYCSSKCQDESWRAHHRKPCRILVQQQDTLRLARFRNKCEDLESQHDVRTYAQAWKIIWANHLPSSRTTSRRLSRKTLLNKFQLTIISE